MIHACKLAQADDFIQQFPDKYDTYIEQGGTNVSGGQRQRLCIARALLKKPKVLILDDSTSAVDTQTDAMIRQALATERPEVTKIIIAQRVSSLMDADKIVVMDGGEIVAVGKHADLIRKCDIYREVYQFPEQRRRPERARPRRRRKRRGGARRAGRDAPRRSEEGKEKGQGRQKGQGQDKDKDKKPKEGKKEKKGGEKA